MFVATSIPSCAANGLETNGIDGFASSTINGCNTRQYHGLLVAATKPLCHSQGSHRGKARRSKYLQCLIRQCQLSFCARTRETTAYGHRSDDSRPRHRTHDRGIRMGSALRFAWMTQPIPTFGPIVTDSVAVAAAIGMQPSDLAGGNLPVQVASSGVPFLYVPLRSRAAVDAVSIERGRLCALLRSVKLEELPVFVFSCQPADDDATVYSRMFVPCIGIPEDLATGAASGPLGAYRLQHNAVSADNASRLVNLQGVRVGRLGPYLHFALEPYRSSRKSSGRRRGGGCRRRNGPRLAGCQLVAIIALSHFAFSSQWFFRTNGGRRAPR